MLRRLRAERRSDHRRVHRRAADRGRGHRGGLRADQRRRADRVPRPDPGLQDRAAAIELRGDRGQPRRARPIKCVVSSSDKSIQASVKVLVFKLEGGVTGVYRVSADGTTYVTLQANAGRRARVLHPRRRGRQRRGHASSPKGEFSVTGKGEFARTWKFDSTGDADEFIDNVVKKVIAQARPDPELPPERRRLRPARPGLRHRLRRHLGHRLGLRRAAAARTPAAGGGVEAGVGAKLLGQRRRDLLLQGQGQRQRPRGHHRSPAASGPTATARS